MKQFSREEIVQFARFIVTGVINTAFGYGCFVSLLYIGLHYSLALFVGTILGVIFNFFSTGHIVFGDRDHRKIPRFVAVYAVLYLVNLLWLRVMTGYGFSPQVAGAIALAPMAILSFVMNKTLVFINEKTD